MVENTSLADLAAVTNMNDGGFGGTGGWLWFLIVMFAIWGGGFGLNGGNSQITDDALNASMQRGFDNQNIMSRFDALQTSQATNALANSELINANKYDNAQLINQNTMATINAQNGITANLTNGFNSVNTNITDVGYQLQNLTCGINRNIDSVKFENAQNTCAITNAIHQEAELTRGLIQANVVQDLRDRLEEKDRLYQAANFQISQNAQTSNILSNLGRWVGNPPVPQYYGMGTTIA